MKKKKTPSDVKWTNVQYGRGAQRSLSVALRTILQLDMSREETLSFLEMLSKMMQSELERVDGRWNLKNPFIDKAINDALFALSKQECHKDD